MRHVDTINVCEVCYLYIESAEQDDADPAELTAARDGLAKLLGSYRDEGAGACAAHGADEDKAETYSTGPCPCCGSRFAGARYPVAILGVDPCST